MHHCLGHMDSIVSVRFGDMSKSQIPKSEEVKYSYFLHSSQFLIENVEKNKYSYHTSLSAASPIGTLDIGHI